MQTAVRKQKAITLEVKLNVVRFENGDSKAKTRSEDLGLREAPVQTIF